MFLMETNLNFFKNLYRLLVKIKKYQCHISNCNVITYTHKILLYMCVCV